MRISVSPEQGIARVGAGGKIIPVPAYRVIATDLF